MVKQQRRWGLFRSLIQPDSTQPSRTWNTLAWCISFASIPLLSFFGRPLQYIVFTFLSPFQLTILLLVVLLIIASTFARHLAMKSRENLLYCFLWLAAGLTVICAALAPVERIHVILFGFFGFFSHRLLGPKVALLLVLTVSGLDELLQYFLPDRVADWRDVLTNAVSSTLGIRLSYLLSRDFDNNRREHCR